MTLYEESRRIPLTRMRRAISRAMTASALIPQFTIEREASVLPLSAMRDRLATDGARLSYSDVLIAAAAASLAAHPDVNASLDGDAIEQHSAVNIGIALALSDGLIAPAIRDAHQLSLGAIKAERLRLTRSAHAGTLTVEDATAATFTISNLGPLGVTRFQALVVPPQAAILAVGAMTRDHHLALTLSCDHRVLDGAPAARFLADVVDRLEACEWVETCL